MASNSLSERALTLDLEFKNRELAQRAAEAAAQQAYLRERMNLIEKGQLTIETDRLAKEYALKQGEFEFQKSMAERQFGSSEEQRRIENALNERRQAFEEECGRYFTTHYRKVTLDGENGCWMTLPDYPVQSLVSCTSNRMNSA